MLLNSFGGGDYADEGGISFINMQKDGLDLQFKQNLHFHGLFSSSKASNSQKPLDVGPILMSPTSGHGATKGPEATPFGTQLYQFMIRGICSKGGNNRTTGLRQSPGISWKSLS